MTSGIKVNVPGGNRRRTEHWCHTSGLGKGQRSARSGKLCPGDNPRCAGTRLGEGSNWNFKMKYQKFLAEFKADLGKLPLNRN